MSPSGAVASSDIVTGPLEQNYHVLDSRRGRAARRYPYRNAGGALLGAPAGSAAAISRGTGRWPTTAGRRPGLARPRCEGAGSSAVPARYAEKTAAATFIACCSTIIYGTVGGWMPLYLAQERHWSTATYGTFYIWWGLIGFLGLFFAGLISDRFGRKPASYVMLLEGAVLRTLWVFAESNTALWVYGLLWSIGFLGFWAPSLILTAEMYPTRGRGIGNGFSWAVAWLVGFVLWPFVTVGIQQSTGSFAKAFLIVPVAMLLVGLGIWLFTPEQRQGTGCYRDLAH